MHFSHSPSKNIIAGFAIAWLKELGKCSRVVKYLLTNFICLNVDFFLIINQVSPPTHHTGLNGSSQRDSPLLCL